MASLETDAELNMLMEEAKAADAKFQVQETPLDEWIREFGVDPFSTKPKKQFAEDGGEIIGDKHYPAESTLRDPLELKAWFNALYRAKLDMVSENPGVSTKQIRAKLSMDEEHSGVLKYYPYIFDVITANPMRPVFYMKMLNRMCDARHRIREGEDVDHVEAELQAYMMKYKEQRDKDYARIRQNQ